MTSPCSKSFVTALKNRSVSSATAAIQRGACRLTSVNLADKRNELLFLKVLCLSSPTPGNQVNKTKTDHHATQSQGIRPASSRRYASVYPAPIASANHTPPSMNATSRRSDPENTLAAIGSMNKNMKNSPSGMYRAQ